MILKTDRNTPLWQWDTGRTVTVVTQTEEEETDPVTELHMAHRGEGDALAVPVREGEAKIPDTLLQSDAPLLVYSVSGDAEIRTVSMTVFTVREREKPTDYLVNESEIYTLRALNTAVEAVTDDIVTLKEKIGSCAPVIVTEITGGTVTPDGILSAENLTVYGATEVDYDNHRLLPMGATDGITVTCDSRSYPLSDTVLRAVTVTSPRTADGMPGWEYEAAEGGVIADSLDTANGIRTEAVCEIVFSGEEDWILVGSGSAPAFRVNENAIPTLARVWIPPQNSGYAVACSHVSPTAYTGLTANLGVGTCATYCVGSTGKSFAVKPKEAWSIRTVAEWKSFLRTEAAAGHPLTAYFPLTEKVTAPCETSVLPQGKSYAVAHGSLRLTYAVDTKTYLDTALTRLLETNAISGEEVNMSC